MTTPPPVTRATGQQPWYVRPGVVLPLIAGLAMVTALFAPQITAGRSGNPILSTYSATPLGARLFYELAQDLGWRVERRLVPDPPDDPRVIHAVLAPAIGLRRAEVHELLDRVRSGGALLLILSGDALGDSLRIGPNTSGDAPAADSDAHCPKPRRTLMSLWPTGRAFLSSLRWRGMEPLDMETFVTIRTTALRERVGHNVPAFVGFPYGRGRIAVGSDPDLLRNDALRVCGFGLDVPAVRALEYLSEGGNARRNRLVFDEYHQGYGAQPGTVATIGAYLGATPSGHAFAQILFAGLVLLMAAAPRAIAPRAVERVERRSPLEHVDALARAYFKVGATRTATTRLLRGMRRRLDRGSLRVQRTLPDDAFLAHIRRAAPALADDAALVQRALDAPVSRRELESVGAALHRIETLLTRS